MNSLINEVKRFMLVKQYWFGEFQLRILDDRTCFEYDTNTGYPKGMVFMSDSLDDVQRKCDDLNFADYDAEQKRKTSVSNACYQCGKETQMKPLKETGSPVNNLYICAGCKVLEVRCEALNEAWTETHSTRPSEWAKWLMVVDYHEAWE